MKKLALFVSLMVVAAGCHQGRYAQISGSGKRELQKRAVAPFTSIVADGAFTIEVTCQKDQSLEVEGDDNVLDSVSADVSSNILRLKNTKNYSTNEPVRFRISVPNLEGLSVNGAERQKGDLTELIWSVPEIIAKLSEQVSLGAGDIIMTGTPAGVAALSPGDQIECGVEGIGTLKVTIGKPAA